MTSGRRLSWQWIDAPGHDNQRPHRPPEQAPQGDLFVEVLTKGGVSNPVVLGHSWGTLVAVALALRDGYPVRGLTLVLG